MKRFGIEQNRENFDVNRKRHELPHETALQCTNKSSTRGALCPQRNFSNSRTYAVVLDNIARSREEFRDLKELLACFERRKRPNK